jgi:hypothetical protein
MDTYSTDSLLMALCRFMCRRGVPSQIQSDRGEQLVAASKQVTKWNFDGIMQWAGKKGIEWVLVHTGGQHFNGQAERMIGLIKKQGSGEVLMERNTPTRKRSRFSKKLPG